MANLRMSRRSGQSELKSWVHLTDGLAHFVTWMVANCCINWHLTVAKCAVPSGLSHRLCCNNRAVRISSQSWWLCLGAKYKDHSQGDVFETSSCARTRQETCMFCSQETRCLMWWQPSECPQDLARANWKAAFISRRELRILWLGWSQIAESTDTWLWQSARCLVAYPIVSVATTELSESVLLAVAIAPKGILLLSQWHRVRMLQPSLATCHPVQCSPNMRVADCSTVWVGKCLQLIYRGALHLTLFWNLYKKLFQLPVK